MKNLIAAVILFLATTSFAYGFQTGSWIDFSSAEGGFSVSVPSQPTFNSKESESNPLNAKGERLPQKVRYTSNLYTSQGEGEIYVFGWVDYEAGFNFDTNAELKANRDSFLQGIGAKLVSEKSIAFEGNPGIEFTAKKDEAWFLSSRIYIIGRRPYMLLFATNKQDNPNAGKYLSSFKLKKKH